MRKFYFIAVVLCFFTAVSGFASTEYSIQDAQEAAVSDAGFSADSVEMLYTDMDREDGVKCYDIKFMADNKCYSYEIKASNLKIMEKSYKLMEYDLKSISQQEKISMAEAQEIALADAKDPKAKVTKAKIDNEDGKIVYEIDLRAGKTSYDYEIFVNGGTIYSRDIDY